MKESAAADSANYPPRNWSSRLNSGWNGLLLTRQVIIPHEGERLGEIAGGRHKDRKVFQNGKINKFPILFKITS